MGADGGFPNKDILWTFRETYIFTDNFYTRNTLENCLWKITDGEAWIIEKIKVIIIDFTNHEYLSDETPQGKDAKHSRWTHVRDYKTLRNIYKEWRNHNTTNQKLPALQLNIFQEPNNLVAENSSYFL